MDINLKKAIKNDIDLVNETLKRLVKPISKLTYSVYRQVIDGGKRLRPLLVLYSSKALGYKNTDDALVVGSVIELVHTASLLHDDIIDEADFRRGRPSANAVFGIEPAVLGGDYLFSLAYNIVLDYDKAIAKRISEAAYTLTEGELLEIEKAFDTSVTIEDYFDIIYKKTAILIEVSCVSGSILAGRIFYDELKEYGKNLGLAFQIRDDCLDYEGDLKEVGKNLGIDLKEGKITLPVLLAMKEDSTLKGLIDEFFKSKDENMLKEVMDIVRKFGLKKAMDKACEFANKSKEAIQSLPRSRYKEYLEAIADYSVERTK